MAFGSDHNKQLCLSMTLQTAPQGKVIYSIQLYSKESLAIDLERAPTYTNFRRFQFVGGHQACHTYGISSDRYGQVKLDKGFGCREGDQVAFALISNRCHFAFLFLSHSTSVSLHVTSNSLRCHSDRLVDTTSISLIVHFDVISMSVFIQFGFTSVLLRSHADATSTSFYSLRLNLHSKFHLLRCRDGCTLISP